MQELTGVNYNTSEHHKDTSKSRQQRDTEDTYKLIETFKDCDPFGSEPSLLNTISGIVAHDKVNVDQAKRVGQSIVESMVGQKITEFSFRRKNQAVTLGSN